ncbi:MAG: YqeG family HAD IIIA-type phosphatase [Lachnospiraceae bacterium]|nr:YqeG family HAD IIIA-type phosphatase [Lachnospiraceae bacterium]
MYPDEWKESPYSIDFDEYSRKGYKGIVFDIDNTLVPHGKPASDDAKELISRLKQIGYGICIVSNNEKERVESFCRELGCEGVWKAHKPDTKGYFKACSAMKLSPASVLCIGDQLITDIHGGNRSGMHTILVNPITRAEEIQVIVKRKLEAPFIFIYRIMMKLKGKSFPSRRLPAGKAVVTDNMGNPLRKNRI